MDHEYDDLIHKKKKWTEEEDALLKSVVEKRGTKDWKAIASFIPGRSGKQCRERWLFALDPTITKSPWTKSEDERLFSLQSKFGNKWSQFVDKFPGRSSSSIKNRWSLLSRRKRERSRLSRSKKSSHRTMLPEIIKESEPDDSKIEQNEIFMLSRSFFDEFKVFEEEFELFN